MNGAALIFISVYVLGVVYKGNTKDLFRELKTDAAFIPWLASFLVLYWLSKTKALGPVGNNLLMLAATGFILVNGGVIFNTLSKFWSK